MGGMFMQEYANKLIVSIDDTVLDKPYSQHMDLVSYFWSGKHHRSVKVIHLLTLYATDQNGQNIPINFRIYDKSESKTKGGVSKSMLTLNEAIIDVKEG